MNCGLICLFKRADKPVKEHSGPCLVSLVSTEQYRWFGMVCSETLPVDLLTFPLLTELFLGGWDTCQIAKYKKNKTKTKSKLKQLTVTNVFTEIKMADIVFVLIAPPLHVNDDSVDQSMDCSVFSSALWDLWDQVVPPTKG